MSYQDNPQFHHAYQYAYKRLKAGDEYRLLVRDLIDNGLEPEQAIAIVRQAGADLLRDEENERQRAAVWLQEQVAALIDAGQNEEQIIEQLGRQGVPARIVSEVLLQTRANHAVVRNRLWRKILLWS